MAEPPGTGRQQLLGRIDARRNSIDAFLRHARPRGNRLVNISIISSAVAAVLTAGPAIGGEKFTDGVAGGLALSSASVVWRTLCVLAVVVSLVAAISTNLSKSHDTARRITSAEATNAALEGLRTLVEFDQVPIGDAAQLYQSYVTKIPWVEESGPGPRPPAPAYGPPPQPPMPSSTPPPIPPPMQPQMPPPMPPGPRPGWGPPGPGG